MEQKTGATIQPATLTYGEAERFTGLSFMTLKRAARAGEDVGLIKCGRRVVFLRAKLAAWLEGKVCTGVNHA